VMFVSIAWLLINIAAQATIAMTSLTYGFNTATSAVILKQGNVSVPLLDHFYPLVFRGAGPTETTPLDEAYMAHLYGSLALNFGVDNITSKPKPGDLFLPSSAMLWYDPDGNTTQLMFLDTSYAETGQSLNSGALSVYTPRTLNVTYTCDSHLVTFNGSGNDTEHTITVEDVGIVYISNIVTNSTIYFTSPNNTCSENENRCTVIEAFENWDISPYYYKCEVTLGQTYNDTYNVSYISDTMAKFATASIAQVGYNESREEQSQIYPPDIFWGSPNFGVDSEMGLSIGLFALGSIAGASYYNPTQSISGCYNSNGCCNPTAGFVLQIGHRRLFLLSIWIIPAFQFIFIVIVAIFANRVKVGPDNHLGMSLLLRPIADALEGVSSGKENSAFRDAKKRTNVKYEKAVHGRWIFKMS